MPKSRRWPARAPVKLVLGLVLAGTVGCAPLARPVVDNRGYIPDQEALATIRPGVDNKMSVASRLGTPTTAASFDGETWYYVSAVQESYLFMRPTITEQDIVAIRFDDNNLVTEISHFDMSDGRDVNFVDRKTPTRGKELSFLEQMFGTFGRIGTSDTSEGPTRR